MARQILYIAKIYPGVNASIDVIAENLSTAAGIRKFTSKDWGGRGLLYWASWYDPWLVGADLFPEHSKILGPDAKPLGEGVWELSLKRMSPEVKSIKQSTLQYAEQEWLKWQISQAYLAYESHNENARLFFGREVHGASLDDSELLLSE